MNDYRCRGREKYLIHVKYFLDHAHYTATHPRHFSHAPFPGNPMLESEDTIQNIVFDELYIGRSASLSRTLTKEDIIAFAAVSGDVNPVHVDPEYADHTPFHGVIAHGMWVAALISRLLGTSLPGPGTIYLEQTLQFLKPVHIGDRLRVTATVTTMDAVKRHVTLNCEIRNQTGAQVLTGVATVIAPAEKVRRARARLQQPSLS